MIKSPHKNSKIHFRENKSTAEVLKIRRNEIIIFQYTFHIYCTEIYKESTFIKSSIFSSMCGLENKRDIIIFYFCTLRPSFLSSFIKVSLRLLHRSYQAHCFNKKERIWPYLSQISSEANYQETHKITQNLKKRKGKAKYQFFNDFAYICTEYLCQPKQASEQTALLTLYLHLGCIPQVKCFAIFLHFFQVSLCCSPSEGYLYICFL